MSENIDYDLEHLRKLFDECDKNNNGTIDWDEFCCMIDRLLGEKSLEEKSIAFNLVDTNHTGLISFEEFCQWWGNR